MINAARSFGRTILVACAAIAPALLLGGCGKSMDEQVDDRLAVAQQAAERAETAQKAAERAAKIVMDQARPGTFGDDQFSDSVGDSSDGESAEPMADTEGMDTAGSDDSAPDR